VAAPADVRPMAVARRSGVRHEIPPHLSIHIFSELNAVEAEWRRFERTAGCTAFQTFDWLAAWQKHIGERRGVRPVVAVGRFADGDVAFILPLCVMRGHLARRLCWLGQDLCDYNAPLLAPDFSQRVTPESFLAAWHDLQVQMQCEPALRHDWIEFEKMPETVGAQTNPFMYLGVSPNPNSAHLAHLGDDWEKFYHAKRSSATRRRDRTKRRHMSQFGDIRFVSAADGEDARQTLEILMDQKGRALARKGVADIFAPAGHRDFFWTSRLIREPGISFTSAASRSATFAQRPIWALYSAIAIITCWQAMWTAKSPSMDRASCICVSYWPMPSTAVSNASISPSATSPTSSIGATPS